MADLNSAPATDVNLALDLDQVEILSGLDEDTRDTILKSLKMRRYSQGEIIFSKGSLGQSLYVIQSGIMNVVVGPGNAHPQQPTSYLVDQIPAGSVFGEMALLLSMPRTATICAQTDAVVWELQRTDFEAVAARSAMLNERLQAVKERRFLRFRNDLEKAVLHPDNIDAKQKAFVIEVFKQIDADDSGAIDKDEMAVLLTRLSGRFFSDEQVTAMMNMLDKDGNGTIEVEEFLAGLPLLAKWLIVSDDTQELDLDRVKLLQGIDAGTKFKIIMALKRREFKQGELVFTKGSEGQSLFFLQDGVMDVVIGDGDADPTNPVLACVCVDQIQPGDIFGEIALLLSMPRTATISVASPTAVAYELARDDFEAAAASSKILQDRLDSIKEDRFARFRQDLETACLRPEDLDETQRAQMLEIFRQIDADGSGAIDKEELALLLQRLAGRKFAEKEVRTMLKTLDKDGNKTIELDEFMAGLPLLAKWLVSAHDKNKNPKGFRKVWVKISHSIHKVFSNPA